MHNVSSEYRETQGRLEIFCPLLFGSEKIKVPYDSWAEILGNMKSMRDARVTERSTEDDLRFYTPDD